MEIQEFKNMPKEKKILIVAKYIIENEATVKETALYFGISISSIKKYINDDCNLKNINENIYLAVKEVQDKLQKEGQIKGGQIGKRDASISDFEVEEIAKKMIENGWTLGQASNYFDNIPTSTLYENLMKLTDVELKNNLQILFDENNKFKGGRL